MTDVQYFFTKNSAVLNVVFTLTVYLFRHVTGGMTIKMNKKMTMVTAVLMTLSLTACSSATAEDSSTESVATVSAEVTSSGSLIDTSDLFTERDLTQEAELTDAVYYTVSDNTDYTISEEGVYVFGGTASEVTITVAVEDTFKVQIVLNGVTITNTDSPVIYVQSADKVFITTYNESTLTVNGTFQNENAVIYSEEDLVLNGTGSLTIESTAIGVYSDDDLKITGGTYNITSVSAAFRVSDEILICAGTFNITSNTDAFHAEDGDEGTIYISGGTFNLNVGDDALHGQAIVQVDGGTFTISAAEGIEGTQVQINGGTWNITATGDGINAGQKSDAYSVILEINGGEINITVADGDTDGLDSNGDLVITGGMITITAPYSAIDYDGTGSFTGGTLIVNGEEVTDLSAVANLVE